jgi:allophanate hydrolase
VKTFPPVSLHSVRKALADGQSLETLVREWWERIEERGDDAVWIWRPSLEKLLEELPTDPSLPLYGIPFAIKDNIDVAGWPTTAACPEFAYTAAKDATVVARLRAAGAIPMGKTNMDQFATGLVGTRSPYGIPRCTFDPDYISGGSSSGSAVAVAAGLCAFSLGTDTAGSGRVPAAFNGIAGLKPTRGRISTLGVVPACRSLDCVSIFAHDAAEAAQVLAIAEGRDLLDPFSRAAESPGTWPEKIRIGVPHESQREFFGDSDSQALYAASIERAAQLGASIVEIDFSVFRDAAQLLYSGPWVAERAAAVGDFISTDRPGTDPTVAGIIRGAGKWTARDCFEASYKLEALRVKAEAAWQQMDVLLLPTAPSHYLVDEVLREPVTLNTRLGTYTNFVNLLDLCAMAVPAGKVPGTARSFGVTFMAPAWQDEPLAALAQQFMEQRPLVPPVPGDYIPLAVAGAHLSGQPLHHQLSSRKARLLQLTRTAPAYQLFSLPNTTPPKPGLVRAPGFAGPGIEVEVYALSPAAFGSFVAEVPAPMCIGTVELADGSRVKGFLCEGFSLEGAADITAFQGWRQWLKTMRPVT